VAKKKTSLRIVSFTEWCEVSPLATEIFAWRSIKDINERYIFTHKWMLHQLMDILSFLKHYLAFLKAHHFLVTENGWAGHQQIWCSAHGDHNG